MKYVRISLAIVAATTLLLLTSCDELLSPFFGVTIEARIDAFEQTLNTEDRSDILDHIHPDMKNRQQLADPTVIDVSWLSYTYYPFTIGSPAVDENDVAVCSFESSDATGTIEFAMALDGYDYKILRLKVTLNNVDEPLEFKRFW